LKWAKYRSESKTKSFQISAALTRSLFLTKLFSPLFGIEVM